MHSFTPFYFLEGVTKIKNNFITSYKSGIIDSVSFVTKKKGNDGYRTSRYVVMSLHLRVKFDIFSVFLLDLNTIQKP